MEGDIERIELEMVAEYERSGVLDVAEWTARHPEHRDGILDFWVWLKDSPRLSGIEAPSPAEDVTGVRDEALRQATLAVSLGASWLEDPIDEAAAEEDQLGRDLEDARRKPLRKGGRASTEFRRAAVYAWVATEWHKGTQPVSRLVMQKTTYFLEQALDLDLFTSHERKLLGPYDRRARYRDAEPIAQKQGWLQIGESRFHASENATKGAGYAQNYLRNEALARRLLQVLQGLTEAEMETWATVHSAARSLSDAGTKVTVQAVRQVIGESSEWQAKLRKRNFSVDAMRSALVHLVRLRLVRV